MKRYIYILIASTFLVSTVKAQLSYGVKAGGALTSMYGGVRSKAGFYAGVFGALPLHKAFSLQAELYYSAQGRKDNSYSGDTWDPTTGTITPGHNEVIPYRLNYLNLPLLVKYNSTCGFFAEAGLQAGLLVSAYAKTSQGHFDLKNAYKSLDLSGTAGIGYQLHNGLGVDLRYNGSLINILKSDDYATYNIVTQLGLFYVLSRH